MRTALLNRFITSVEQTYHSLVTHIPTYSKLYFRLMTHDARCQAIGIISKMTSNVRANPGDFIKYARHHGTKIQHYAAILSRPVNALYECFLLQVPVDPRPARVGTTVRSRAGLAGDSPTFAPELQDVLRRISTSKVNECYLRENNWLHFSVFFHDSAT
ncbi:hypothetical protein UYSO10_3402 [Kosakonia radicincitans]|nr:hypothetical protein UYSO10_3402 [Kosakonia radicincitans]